MDDIKLMNIVDIELNSGNLHRSWLNHSIGTGDAKANCFGVRLFRNGEAVSLTGGSVQGFFRNSHGENIAITSGNKISGNVAYVVLPQACYNYEGQFTLAIKVINSSAGVTGTMRIVDGVVNNTNTGNAVAPTGTVPTYQEVLSVYNEMVAAKEGSVRFDEEQSLTAARKKQARLNIDAASLEGTIAPAYSDSEVYDVGAHCSYNGNLYRCKTAITTPESWTSSHWTAVVLGDDIKEQDDKLADLKSAINEQLDGIVARRWYTGTTVGGTLNCRLGYFDSIRSLFMPVYAGDKLVISCVGGSDGRAYYLLNSNLEVVEMADASITLRNYTLVIPSGVSYAVVQTNNSSIWSTIRNGESKLYFDGLYMRRNVLPMDSRFDKNTTVANGKAGLFALRYNTNSNSIVKKTDESEPYFRVTLDSTSGSRPGIWVLDWWPGSYKGRVKISFDIRTQNTIKLYFGNGEKDIQASTPEFGHREIYDDVTTYFYTDHRIFFYSSESSIFDIKNLCIECAEEIVLPGDKELLIVQNNILPTNSRFDGNSTVADGAVGIFALRYKTGNNAISKVGTGSSAYFNVTLDTSSGSNPGIWAINWLPASYIGDFRISADLDLSASENDIRIHIGDVNHYLPSKYKGRYVSDVIHTTRFQYDDRRLFIYSIGNASFTISNLCIEFLDSDAELLNLANSIENGEAMVADIVKPLKNYSYKTASIERGTTDQCVIGLLGDSWTQHNDASYLSPHTNYIEPLVLYLRQKYGNAGGGFYSFSISHGDYTSKMGCAVSADANDTRSTDSSSDRDSITYRDQVDGCRWVDAADATFHNGAWLVLNVVDPHNKFVIHFYGDSGSGTFTYKLDNGEAVTVNASEYTGHSTITVNTTNAAHTIRFDVTSGDVMLFGVDMQKIGVAGIRVHKLANKGASTTSFTIVDASAWKDGVESLGLDTMMILLGINDGASATTSVYNNLTTIINNILAVNQYIDLAIVQPSNTRQGNYSAQATYQMKVAKEFDASFVSLIPLFGSPEQIVAKGTFYDSVHPTKAGGRMIADYLEEMLFK